MSIEEKKNNHWYLPVIDWGKCLTGAQNVRQNTEGLLANFVWHTRNNFCGHWFNEWLLLFERAQQKKKNNNNKTGMVGGVSDGLWNKKWPSKNNLISLPFHSLTSACDFAQVQDPNKNLHSHAFEYPALLREKKISLSEEWMTKFCIIKSQSTASTWLSTYTHWLQTQVDKHLTLVMTLIALCCTRQS